MGPVDARDLDERISRLDVAGKVRLLTGASMFTLHGDESIGLSPMAFSDGPTGVRGLAFTGGPVTCLLPSATVLASAWSTEQMEEVGGILAEEAERQQVHVVLGPTINLHRTPLGGRVFEAYSEDPLLTGHLAAAYVRGVQAGGIGACLKHVVANEAETHRHSVNSVVDDKTLREVYLRPFEIAVEESRPWSMMAAYNKVNGTPATEHGPILNDIVKDGWGWDGVVISDWFATTSAGPAANGGLDLVMPGPVGPWGAALVAAVESGQVAESVIDDHVRRLLRLASRVGALDGMRRWRTQVPAPDGDVRRAQLTRVAAAGMVVLANHGATLPLRRDQSVALVGRLAIETTCMGGGSASVRAPYQVSIAEGLAAAVDGVTVVDGVGVRLRPRAARSRVIGEMRVQLFGASGALLHDELTQEATTVVGLPGVELAEALHRVVLTAVVPAGTMRVGVLGLGRFTLRCGDLSKEVELVTQSTDLGEGILRPPGWQTDVFLTEPTELVAEVTGTGESILGLVAEPTPATDDEAIAAAVVAAGAADVAVVVVGLTEEQETEALDKTTLALPGRQDDLVVAVAAAASRTVVVVNAATPILAPWRDQVDAILCIGLPGQEGGRAVAAALLGDLEPAGRLTISWPAADGASPAWEVRPTNGELCYSEGPFIGYRGFAADRAPAPAYWFGHGLGYGDWAYGVARVDQTTFGQPVVTVEVTNVSTRDSVEVVQAYWQPPAPDEPTRLVGWTRVDVVAGGSQSCEIACGEVSGGRLILARGLGDVRADLELAPPAEAAG